MPRGAQLPPPAPSGAEADEGYVPSEEELQRLAALGLVDEEMVENLRRTRGAEEAAALTPPEGRQAGRTYVAANPLEHLASAGSRVAALLRAKKLREEREGLMGRKRRGYETRFNVGFQAYGYPRPMTFGD
ncbi:MAG TPA: hypothetical protein VFI16_06385 [Anaeromyxobacteraceae bacterium]|nr:hypothetical protein [Anaeromyxobacteraceae bacterium]